MKVALVNRMYRVQLGYRQKEVEWKVAVRLVKGAADCILAPLSRIRRLNDKTLASIVEAHERLVHLLYRVTDRVENSFCSKYLSFHFLTVVPIFDQYAEFTAKRLVHLPGRLYTTNWNQSYAKHCKRIVSLLGSLKNDGVKEPDLKVVDQILYGSRGD